MMRRLLHVMFLTLVLVCASGIASAQEGEPPLDLGLSRDLGYGSGAQVQGRFSYRVSGPDDLVRVEFLMDGEVIGEDTEPPFRLRFNTGDFDLGWHTLSAVGYTASGAELRSNTLQRQFVSGQTGIYIVVAVVVLALGFRGISYYLTRDKDEGRGRKGYGLYGGAICSRCGRPFPRPWWAPGLLVGRLARCPHCGKWALTQRATPQMLAQAEAFAREMDEEEAQAETESPVGSASEEERLRRQLEESRYEDV